MLSHGKGAAFLLQPATGVLQPYGHQIIEITAFSNMWGKYYDNVVCKVSFYFNVDECLMAVMHQKLKI